MKCPLLCAAVLLAAGCATLRGDPLSSGDEAYLRATALASRGDADGSIAAYTAALRAYASIPPGHPSYASVAPSLAGAYSARGYQYFLKKDYAGALADATELIRLQPADPDARLSRALRRQAAGDCAGAMEDAEKAYALKPDAELLQQKLNVLLACGRREEALRDCDALAALEGRTRPELYCLRGALLESLGRAREARRDFEAGCAEQASECCRRLDAPATPAR